ncbi:hypothetical protein ABUW04_12405 [Streptacidiphilus sp. N1-10]|uniref:Uncharacterized protein n=1 Tax=Streptacidiphilus jeojiensis TaxID=3229225 RepID=A0ABV6XLC1_9ACTN
MADFTALYGLITGLGGAAFGGAASYFGPLRLYRRQDAVKRSEERSKALDDRTGRLIAFRGVTRTNIHYLKDVLRDLEAGRQIDPDAFESRSQELVAATWQAHDDLLKSQVSLISLEGPSPHIREATRLLREAMRHPSSEKLADARRNVVIADIARDHVVLHIIDLIERDSGGLVPVNASQARPRQP